MSKIVQTLLEGVSGVTPEFKTQAEALLESHIAEKVQSEIVAMTEKHASALVEQEQKFGKKLVSENKKYRDSMEDRVDKFLTHIVTEWARDNALAIDSEIKTNLAENFIDGLASLMANNNIQVPDAAANILEKTESKLRATTSKLDEALSTNVKLAGQVEKQTRKNIIESATQGLSLSEKDRVLSLAESFVFTDNRSFKLKVKTLAESVKGPIAAGVKPLSESAPKSVSLPTAKDAGVPAVDLNEAETKSTEMSAEMREIMNF